MFLTSSNYSEKSVKRARSLNIVQSVQNFAHNLIFLCVTRAALWSHTFPTFSFWGHTIVHPNTRICYPVEKCLPDQAIFVY